MRLCGWETRSLLDRYNIVDGADVDAAVAKRFNDTVAAQLATSTVSPDWLTSALSNT
jgi:hypothetical protein